MQISQLGYMAFTSVKAKFNFPKYRAFVTLNALGV